MAERGRWWRRRVALASRPTSFQAPDAGILAGSEPFEAAVDGGGDPGGDVFRWWSRRAREGEAREQGDTEAQKEGERKRFSIFDFRFSIDHLLSPYGCCSSLAMRE